MLIEHRRPIQSSIITGLRSRGENWQKIIRLLLDHWPSTDRPLINHQQTTGRSLVDHWQTTGRSPVDQWRTINQNIIIQFVSHATGSIEAIGHPSGASSAGAKQFPKWRLGLPDITITVETKTKREIFLLHPCRSISWIEYTRPARCTGNNGG